MKKILIAILCLASLYVTAQNVIAVSDKGVKNVVPGASDSVKTAKDTLAAHNTRIGAVTVSDALKAPLISPSFTTPALGVATATSLAIGESLNASSLVDFASTTKGLLIPRMTSTQRDSISTPASGLLVYNTTKTTLDAYNGTSWNSIAGNFTRELLAYQALGSPILASTVVPISTLAASTALTAGRCTWTAVWVEKEITVTGVMYWQTTQGNFTGSNYNGVGLYSYSAGTLTLIDTSTRDENIWKATASTWNQKAFANGTRVIEPGLYFIMSLYNNSAQTTAPQIGSLTGNTQTIAPLTTNSGKLFSFVSSITTPASSQAMSGTTAGTYYALVLY